MGPTDPKPYPLAARLCLIVGGASGLWTLILWLAQRWVASS
jgi:hypothetical protein